jgi:hypothetical protein
MDVIPSLKNPISSGRVYSHLFYRRMQKSWILFYFIFVFYAGFVVVTFLFSDNLLFICLFIFAKEELGKKKYVNIVAELSCWIHSCHPVYKRFSIPPFEIQRSRKVERGTRN